MSDIPLIHTIYKILKHHPFSATRDETSLKFVKVFLLILTLLGVVVVCLAVAITISTIKPNLFSRSKEAVFAAGIYCHVSFSILYFMLNVYLAAIAWKPWARGPSNKRPKVSSLLSL
jgi:hypothetical protein